MDVNGIEFERVNDGCIIDRVSPAIEYDEDYMTYYREISDTPMSADITSFRKGFAEVGSHDGLVLDFGCGMGLIVSEDTTGYWRGFDINPATAPELGDKFVNIRQPEDLNVFDTICFFDSLEHLHEPELYLKALEKGKKVVVSLPIMPADMTMEQLVNWKHWKPQEHFMYCTKVGFIKFMEGLGFGCICNTDVESRLGRESIRTFAFRKK